MKITLLAESSSTDGGMNALQDFGERLVYDPSEIQQEAEKAAEEVYERFGESRYIHAYKTEDDGRILTDNPLYSVRYRPSNGGTYIVPEVFESGVLI